VGRGPYGDSSFDFLHCLLVGRGAAHTEEKMILVLDEENQNILAQLVFFG
jgi:hypothetical protein